MGNKPYPISSVRTLENPDRLVRLQAFGIPLGAERAVTAMALPADLNCENLNRRFFGSLRNDFIRADHRNRLLRPCRHSAGRHRAGKENDEFVPSHGFASYSITSSARTSTGAGT